MIDPAVLETVSVPLALEDAVPVTLSAAGLVAIGRGIGQRLDATAGRLAVGAAVVIGLGGAAKVGWKVLAAGFERDVTWLDDLLFPMLAVGFVAMAWLVHLARRGDDRARSMGGAVAMAAAATALVIGLLVAVDVDLGLRVARWTAIVASLTTSWRLISIARHADDRRSAGFLAVNVLVTLVLAGLARIEAQTLVLQWIEQSINTVSQALFLLAALRIAAPSTPWRLPDADATREPATEVVA